MKVRIVLALLLLASSASFAQETEKDTLNQMEEVVIEGNTKTYIYKNGNIKIDIANSIHKTVSNTLDLLSRLPKIQISPDREKITVIGKGAPLIYIDNQKVEMNDLEALSVEDIKTIEIIDNPSSKYEAEGRSVILITRKTSKKEGFQLVFTENAAFKKKFNNYLGLNSSLKLSKTEFKANFNYNRLNPWESNGSDYTIPAKAIESNYRVAGYTKRDKYVYGVGVYHKINEEEDFSFTTNGTYKDDDFDFSTKTHNKIGEEQNRIQTLGKSKEHESFINSFFNYNKKITNWNASLFAGLQYSNYSSGSFTSALNNYNETTYQPFQQTQDDFNVDVFSGRIDFEKKFKNEMKWEMGAQHSSAIAHTDLKIKNFEQDLASNSKYKLKEKNTAAYAQLSGSFMKISWMAGVRAENTRILGRYEGEPTSVDKNYTTLFPKAELSMPIDSTKTLNLNYGRSISRPDYSSTSQGITYINPYFAFATNINLNPSITSELAANFQYKDKSVKFSYYENSNVINYGFLYNEPQNLLIYRPQNFEKETGYNLEFVLPFSSGFWSSNNTISLILNKIEDTSAVIGDTKPYAYYYSNHVFKLKNELQFSVTGWGLTSRNEGVFQRNSYFQLDLAASKTFFKNLSCTVNYNNVFMNRTFTENFEVSKVRSNAIFFVDNCEFSIAIRYTFGKIKDSIYKEKEVNENSGRIK
ncbi:outer membrane beta-barrel family protein [Flavobacterium microcysteis]|uniref:TonB-dependent receptor n=1 Tax=Flavobacterium microcysteis TaxID=2596891 RepID=A0A501QDD8_9FLAO|nr:outer membrane beta-barrel family protein [Flavobacterium microcysteis]TPD70412.1 TonB-dependent receptor [Flavobacterium microcysteis]